MLAQTKCMTRSIHYLIVLLLATGLLSSCAKQDNRACADSFTAYLHTTTPLTELGGSASATLKTRTHADIPGVTTRLLTVYTSDKNGNDFMLQVEDFEFSTFGDCFREIMVFGFRPSSIQCEDQQCEWAQVTYLNSTGSWISEKDATIQVSVDDCDSAQKIVSGSFEATVYNAETEEDMYVSGYFKDVCYSVVQ